MKKLCLKIILVFSSLFIGCEKINSNKKLTHTLKKTYTYNSVDGLELKLDYYKPKQTKTNGYTIVYVHGGSFSNGQRDSDKAIKLAEDLGENGYSTISLSYRLTRKGLGFGCNVLASDKLKTFDEASNDISDALNFIIENKTEFSLDVNKVVIFGASAGAEAVFNLLFTSSTNNLPEHFNFKALICKSGALTSLDELKNIKTFIQLFHGTEDQLVPYSFGSHHNCKKDDPGYLELYGSRAIANELKKSNIPYYLVSLNNGDHAMSGFKYSDYIKEVLFFLDQVKSHSFKKPTEKTYTSN